MKFLKIFTTLLFAITSAYGYNAILLNHLQSMQVNYIFEKNDAYGKAIQKAFQSFHKISKQSGPMTLLQQNNISNLFLLSPEKHQSSEFNESLKISQNIMIIYIYAKIFQEYITQTQRLIEQALDSLHYWETEKFYDKLPMLRKHPVYWYHSPAHKKLVCNHVQALNSLIDQATLLLGIALHGQHQFRQIQDAGDILPQLLQATDPLIKHFQTIQLPNSSEPDAMFQNTIWLHQNIQVILQNHHKILHDHAKPHHIFRHGFAYSCIALAAIGTYALYKTHETEIPEYKKKAVENWDYILEEYIKYPLFKLKDTLWNNTSNPLGDLKPWPVLQKKPLKLDPWLEVNNATTRFTGTQEDLNNLIKILNQNKEAIALRYNNLEEFIIEIMEVSNQNKKEISTTINKLAKEHQLTMAIAAIAPTVLAAWGIYYTGNSLYNKYIKHETWYQPMQLIVRNIDKILNKLTAENTISFADDGMLHVLTRQLKAYISCLPNEELQLIEQDLHELSAYHLSYQQKRGVLDRMYRTYEFLK